MFKFYLGPKSHETRFRCFCDVFVSVPVLFWQKKTFFIFVILVYRWKNYNFLKEKVSCCFSIEKYFIARLFNLDLARTLSGCCDSADFFLYKKLKPNRKNLVLLFKFPLPPLLSKGQKHFWVFYIWSKKRTRKVNIASQIWTIFTCCCRSTSEFSFFFKWSRSLGCGIP